MSVPEHGTPKQYRRGCHCGPCRDAIAAAGRHRTRMKAYGRWTPYYTDAGPAREHVITLREAGLGYRRVAALAGVPPQTLNTLLYGHHGNPPTRKIRAATAAAILAVRPALDDLPAAAPVDAAGTVRRIQALVAAGWSMERLAGLTGMHGSNFRGLVRQDKVTAGTARTVRGLYGELQYRPPPERTHREKLAASRSRNYAAARGWVTAGWWDEHEGSPHFIDDPDARPAPGWKRRAVS